MTRAAERSAPIGIDRAVAVLLLSVQQELAAQVIRRLPDDHLDRVTRAMKELQEITVADATIRDAFEQAIRRLRAGGRALGDVASAMDSMLVKAFGPEQGATVSQRANTEILAKRPFAMFETLTAEDLANLLAEEHPQIAAVFLAHLERAKAGRVLAAMPEESRADLVLRVATLDRTPPDVVQRVLEVMRRKVKDLGLTASRTEPKAWAKAAAQILNNMGGGEKAILELVEQSDATVAANIREELFTFDDIGRLDKRSIQKVLSQIDSRMLAIALKAASTDVEQNVFSNLSKRAADMVAEERESLGPMPLSEVLENQRGILAVIRDLLDRGEVTAGAAGSEMMV
jgi:flagellar motor switch protein FliG